MHYDDEYKEDSIRNFIMDVTSNLQKKQQFTQKQVKEAQDSKIPAYSFGIPIYGDKNNNHCFLKFVEAYKSTPQQGQNRN